MNDAMPGVAVRKREAKKDEMEFDSEVMRSKL
jgi:hypothetical protein